MEWKYDKGDKVMFTCTDSDWKKVGPVRCKIIRRLTDMDADLCETGPMYEVMFLDMVLDPLTGLIETYDAFEDELKPTGQPETVRDERGNEVDFAAATMLMDDGIRERLHMEMAPCGAQEFYDAYCRLHEERFGERFDV